MSRRPPARPPELTGYTFERLLGSGGFADVYLYTQHMPRRKVAVKVLTTEAAAGQSREQFVAEANLMAQLSTHSSIVAIYHADTAPDGRPFLVMQFCPLPNLSERLKVRPLGVAEALGIGVRLAGAVETAHRAGIVHRDIKPANILTTEYGRPALTDFGIAGLTSATVEESAGVSIPWAPPESLEGHSAQGVTGDVYSLAATIYTLLAGRSPFHRPGGPNGRLDYTVRIRRDPVPPIDRGDAPASLERVLSRAMAKNAAQRHPSALELGRALQVVEQELRLPMTDIEVPDTSWMGSTVSDDDGAEQRTVVRQVVEVDPHRPADASASGRSRGAGSDEEDVHTVRRRPGAGSLGPDVGTPGQDTGGAGTGGPGGAENAPPVRDGDADEATDVRGQAAGETGGQTESVGTRRPRTAVLVGAVVGLVAAVGLVIGAGLLHGPEDEEADPDVGTTVPLPDDVEPPAELSGQREDGTVTFSWQAPDGVDPAEVRYVWQRIGPGADPTVHPTTEETLRLADVTDEVCLSVKTVASTGRTSSAAEACVEGAEGGGQ